MHACTHRHTHLTFENLLHAKKRACTNAWHACINEIPPSKARAGVSVRPFCMEVISFYRLLDAIYKKEEAEKEIIRFCQNQTFHGEVSSLERGNHNLKRSSPLCKLDPVLKDGLLKVGSRLSKSSMPAEVMLPAIIPKDSHITI